MWGKERTDITIDIVLHVVIVRPEDRVDCVGKCLEEQPEAEEGDAEIPALADKAGQQYEK